LPDIPRDQRRGQNDSHGRRHDERDQRVPDRAEAGREVGFLAVGEITAGDEEALQFEFVQQK
jgi:hypothetical protein